MRSVSLSVFALLLLARPALAQVTAGDAALAEKLFDDGRQLMAKKNYAEACPKLAESERLDPGVGTLLNLGECYEKSGKVASAWATYREANGSALRDGQKKRAAFADGRAKALEPSLSYLVIDAPPGGSAQVLVDGKTVGATSLGSAMPFDPGRHHLEATAPGRLPWAKDVELGVKESVHVAIELAPAPAAVAPPVAEGPPPPAARDGHTQRTLGLVAAVGVGVVGLGLSSYFGLRAKNKNDEAGAHCDATSCDPIGGERTSEARSFATTSTVFAIVGAVVLAAGVVLFVTAPPTLRTARLDGFAF